MKIKVIFWGDEPLDLIPSRVKLMGDLKSGRCFEKVSSDLYEYIQIGREDVATLYKEVMHQCERTILCIMTALQDDEIKWVKKMQAQYASSLIVLMKELPYAALKEDYRYVPAMCVTEILEMLPVFAASFKEKQNLREAQLVKGSTLIMGYEQCASDLGKFVKRVFANWQYISLCRAVKFNVYSHQELDVRKLGELEDIFYEYTAEGATLELRWHQNARGNEGMYFLIEGK